MWHHELFSTNEIHVPIFKRNTCKLFVNKEIQKCQTFMNAGVCMYISLLLGIQLEVKK